jgi:hypothetical protein
MAMTMTDTITGTRMVQEAITIINRRPGLTPLSHWEPR